jgi:hypothetical protein
MPLPDGGLLPAGGLLPSGPVYAGPIVLTTTAQEIYDALTPLMESDQPGYSDADNGYAGAALSGAFATMVDPVSDIVRDQADGTPGYAILFDPDALVSIGRPEWLPWLAQFVGDSQAVLATTDVNVQKAIIKTPLNFTRGRPSTMIAAAQNTLTGTRTVVLNQFLGGSSNAIEITTFTAETPNPTATINAVMAVMPAWIVPTFSVVTGGTYAALAASHSSYSLMEAAHTTYADIPTNPSA